MKAIRRRGQTACLDCPAALPDDRTRAGRCAGCRLAVVRERSRRAMAAVRARDPAADTARASLNAAWSKAARQVARGMTDPPSAYPAWWVHPPPAVRPRLSAPPWVPRPCDLVARAVRKQARPGAGPVRVAIPIPFEVGDVGRSKRVDTRSGAIRRQGEGMT